MTANSDSSDGGMLNNNGTQVHEGSAQLCSLPSFTPWVYAKYIKQLIKRSSGATITGIWATMWRVIQGGIPCVASGKIHLF